MQNFGVQNSALTLYILGSPMTHNDYILQNIKKPHLSFRYIIIFQTAKQRCYLL